METEGRKYNFTRETAALYGKKGGNRRRGHKASHTLQAQEVRKRLIERFYGEADQWYEAIRDSGLGHFAEFKLPGSDKVRVYKRSPNVLAIKEMFDRAFGKVPQMLEIDTPQREPLSLFAVELLKNYVDDDTYNDLRGLAIEISDVAEDGGPRSVDSGFARFKKKPSHIRPLLLPEHHQNGGAASPDGPDRGNDAQS